MSLHSPIIEDVPQQPELSELEKAAERADHQGFALVARTIDWSCHRPTDLTRAIDLALAFDLITLARELAQQGPKIFPEDQRLQQAMAVLSPPVVRGTHPVMVLDLKASQRWLKEHASRYQGQWVAVQSGTLLGAAPTLQELHQQLGPDGRTAKTIVVKVLR